MDIRFPALRPMRLTGSEPLTSIISPAPEMNVLAFWQWAVSNLADNTTRGLLAEYIVAHALGVDQHPTIPVWGRTLLLLAFQRPSIARSSQLQPVRTGEYATMGHRSDSPKPFLERAHVPLV